MVDIAIPQRTELPPSRVGAVKPSFGAASQAGQKQIAKAVTGVASSTFENLVKTRAANEEAQFQGHVNTSMQEFDTFVASNPGASFEDLQDARNNMLDGIKQAGGTATTKLAKTNNANWYDRNFESIKEQSETSMVAIRSKQELATAGEISKTLINNFDREGLEAFTQQQIANGLWEKEGAEARLVNQLEIIDDAQAKVVRENLTAGLEARFFDIASLEGFPAAEAMLDDPEVVKEMIEAGMDRKDIVSLRKDVEDRITKQQAQNQLELEAKQEGQRDDITKLIFDKKDYKAASAAVEASNLDEPEQRSLRSDIDRRATAVANGTKLPNDRVEEARLYELSLDIWKGAITKTEFDKELTGNAKKLDDTAYKRVATSAANTLKSSQAESLSRANTEAGRLIVDHVSEDAF